MVANFWVRSGAERARVRRIYRRLRLFDVRELDQAMMVRYSTASPLRLVITLQTERYQGMLSRLLHRVPRPAPVKIGIGRHQRPSWVILNHRRSQRPMSAFFCNSGHSTHRTRESGLGY